MLFGAITSKICLHPCGVAAPLANPLSSRVFVLMKANQHVRARPCCELNIYFVYLQQLHHRVGAKISSDSWGSVGAEAVVYDTGAQSFDAFAWRNPDFISLVAGGNNGRLGRYVVTCTGHKRRRQLVAMWSMHANRF